MYIIIFIVLILIAVIAYVALYMVKDYLIFQPYTSCESDIDYDPSKYEQQVVISDFKVQSTDDALLHCIYIKNLTKSNTVFLYAHGNAGDISSRTHSKLVHLLLQYGSVLLFDYRGYGMSTGYPYAQGVKDDILCVYQYMTEHMGYTSQEIIVYGESLGCAMVSWLTSYLLQIHGHGPRACIMQAGFYSLREIVASLVCRPVSYLISNDFDNVQCVLNVKSYNVNYPVYILHSRSDGLIDYDHAQRLAEETGSLLLEIKGTHNAPEFTPGVMQMLHDITQTQSLRY